MKVNGSTRLDSRRGALVLQALVLALAVPGCFSPDLQHAECLSCPDGLCPGDMICREKYCVEPGSETQCSAGVGGAGGAPKDPGSGGHAGDGPVIEPSGGASATGGTSSGGSCGTSCSGASGDDEPRPLTLSVSNVLEHACTGDEVHVELSAVGGVPPYTWKFVDDASGLDLETDHGTATLRGELLTPGDYSITITARDRDGNHDRRDLTLNVGATPVVLTSSNDLPSVCQNERYAVSLVAEGGDDSDYEWTTDLPPEIGLFIDDDALQGRFVGAEAAARSIPFSVSVESGGCRSAPVMLTLHALAQQATACLQVRPADYWPVLPDPCRGLEYSAALLADGGEPPYVWRDLSLPEGLAFDATTATLAGKMTTAGTGTVEVADATGRAVQADFSLNPRDSCWLAYLAGDVASKRLELFDPSLKRSDVLPRDHDETAGPVIDFKFSPNGRWLAYRTGSDSSRGRLTLVDMTTLGQATLDFDAVTLYVWSDDSASLLVAFETDAGRFLGGVVPASAPGAPVYTTLTPGAANVDSPPLAFGSSAVAFLSAEDSIQRLLVAERTPAGFSAAEVQIDSFFDYGDSLHRAPDGVFGVPLSDFDITYWPADGSPAWPHNEVLVAPSGRYVARPADGALALFLPTEDSSNPSTPPHDSSPGCEQMLAWAESPERVACTRAAQDDDPGPQLTFFDIDPATDTISPAVPLHGSYTYPTVSPSIRHRLFSPSGSRFAFTTDASLYLARLAPAQAVIGFGRDFALDPGADAELAFSPDETRIAAHRGSHLSLFALDDDTPDEVGVDGNLPPSRECSDVPRAAPGTSCGEARADAAFAWSSASDLIAYCSDQGVLRVYAVNGNESTDVASDCAGNCRAGNEFAFQP